MATKNKKVASRLARKIRVRKQVNGTPERPRLNVFRSNKYIYASIIDDASGNTIAAASSLEKSIKSTLENTSNKAAARAVGTEIAKRAKAKGIEKVVFDRNGYLYHGRVKELADGAREAGLTF